MGESRGRGRPSTYSEEMANTICERLADGESLLAILENGDGMPAYRTVMQWLEAHEDFAQNYARSRAVHADREFERIQQIADDGSNDWIESNDPNNPGYRLNGENIARSRLRVDTLKWRLGRMAPKKYGDRTAVEMTGADGGPIVTRDETQGLGAVKAALVAMIQRGTPKSVSGSDDEESSA